MTLLRAREWQTRYRYVSHLSPVFRWNHGRKRCCSPPNKRTSAVLSGRTITREARGSWIVDRGSRIGDDCAQLSAAKECVADAFSSSDFASRWETTHFSSQDWNFISLPRSWRGSTTHLWLPLQRLWVSNENACRAASVRGRCAFRWYRNRWSTESNVTDYYWYSRDWSWHMRYGFFENDEWILSLN